MNLQETQTFQIQRLILDWLSSQSKPVSHAKMRDICNAAATAVLGHPSDYNLYSYFYLLARMGLVECGIDGANIVWQMTSPMVLYRDMAHVRRWIGINLTEDQKDNIHSDFIEDDSYETFDQRFVFWETSVKETGEKQPVINNPPVQSLLKCIPACSPTVFGIESNGGAITRFTQIFDCNKWRNRKPDEFICDGYYRWSEQVFSARIYLQKGKQYAIGKSIDDSFWACVMSCIDSHRPVIHYCKREQKLTFLTDPPIMLARILWINEMFDHPVMDNKTYFCVEAKIFAELRRIVQHSVTMEE